MDGALRMKLVRLNHSAVTEIVVTSSRPRIAPVPHAAPTCLISAIGAVFNSVTEANEMICEHKSASEARPGMIFAKLSVGRFVRMSKT